MVSLGTDVAAGAAVGRVTQVIGPVVDVAFPPGKLPGDPRFAQVYFDMSQGEGNTRGSWNSDANFDVVSSRDQQCAVDGGDGMPTVGLTEQQVQALQALATRTASLPDADPLTGADLGSGAATEAEPA